MAGEERHGNGGEKKEAHEQHTFSPAAISSEVLDIVQLVRSRITLVLYKLQKKSLFRIVSVQGR